jgi:hypothetical protein
MMRGRHLGAPPPATAIDAAMKNDETGNSNNLLLRKLQQFTLLPSPPHRDESTGILSAGM